MKPISAALSAAFLVLFSTSPVIADVLIKDWSTAKWNGGGFQDVATGEIYCLLWHEYGNYREIELGMDAHGYYLVLSDPATFEFANQEPFGTALQVDSGAPAEFQAYADNAGTMVVDLATNTEFVQQLAHGTELRLPAWGTTFGLSGSADAIAQGAWRVARGFGVVRIVSESLHECVEARLRRRAANRRAVAV